MRTKFDYVLQSNFGRNKMRNSPSRKRNSLSKNSKSNLNSKSPNKFRTNQYNIQNQNVNFNIAELNSEKQQL